MRINLSCAVCGKNRFAFPEGGDDRTEVTCVDCGHIVGTMGELKEAVAQAVIELSKPTARTPTGGNNG